ncbi:DUF1801 domain-containing protein [Luteipulveratus sp. YIM 133132]|uniref:iron chaperone n=1 Tax=Luteipulveratus flavus TaxID=3031728 RepID=UPI0023B039FC|nr:DUF1801 domain-containing protein [Luteipulveratus sp. YIM 133132]MDE9366374.1 DUF1801 domain-containing protein [Luteipulveratus sp. YIM 133132]
MAQTTKKSAAKKSGTASGFTADERAAMKERAAELKGAGGRGAKKKADEAQACLDKIAEMGDADRALAERIHAVVTSVAPDLDAKTWYGMPAYARDGKVLCFFKPGEKFGARYATFGFTDTAQLDDGNVWPTEYAIADLTDADVKRLEKIVEQAASR